VRRVWRWASVARMRSWRHEGKARTGLRAQRLSVEVDKLPHSQNKEALRSLSKNKRKWISLLRSTPEPKKPEKEQVAEEAQDDSWVGKAIRWSDGIRNLDCCAEK
jgi:hypothetical protein